MNVRNIESDIKHYRKSVDHAVTDERALVLHECCSREKRNRHRGEREK